jgi:glycosyltransferase involved in cell wall biosynthesis
MYHNSHNILHVVNIYFVIPFFIGGQFRYFSDKGYKLHVVCSESPYLKDYAAQQGFDYREIPVLRAINLTQDLKSIWQICKYIKAKQIGIVVGHTPKGGLLSMVAGWLTQVPNRIYFRHGLVYQTSHGLKRFILMSVDRLASALATRIVCVSPSVLEHSIEDGLAPAGKQLILHKGTCCGIDTEGKFNPANIDSGKLQAMKSRWGIHDGDWVIGYSGRLVRDKGIIELIRAFREVKKENPRYKLLLVGMFEVRDALPEDVQHDIKNDPQIVWTDFQNADMEYFYAMMNVYVLASYREGFPTGVLEAQAMAVPVITTRATGCCDSIVEGETGLFVDHDVQQLADAIRCLHDDRSGLSGDKARNWVRQNFENHIVWKEIEKLY